MKRLVVLDTNCLVQMLSIHSPYRPAWQAFREGKYELCVSDEILNEYIVSKDAHFKVLENIPFPKVVVIRLEQFLKELSY